MFISQWNFLNAHILLSLFYSTQRFQPVLPAAELITETAPPAPEETFLVEEEEGEEAVPDTFKATEAAPVSLKEMRRFFFSGGNSSI